MEIRNIAIIAHVDHGKTTITDMIMKQTGMVADDISMDTNDLEKERGITIYSKNASFFYKDTKVNIVDTPGHADFGSEVERVLRAVDAVSLVVDAQEGPMPQTRFVLKKSLELGLKPLVIINKMDKPAADPARVHDEILELFIELGANDQQLNFPYLYAIGRNGQTKLRETDDWSDMTPLLDLILAEVPAAVGAGQKLRMQPFSLAYDNFLGRLAIGRVREGELKVGPIVVKKNNGEVRREKVIKIFTFKGTQRDEVDTAVAGDLVMVAGIPHIVIGETLCQEESQEALPSIEIDEPTITLEFLVNDSPMAGQEGDFVTNSQLRERLEKELEVSVGLEIDFDSSHGYKVSGRGELHIAILLENMRREGYEVMVSQPEVIIKEIDGAQHEPFEEVIVDVPPEFSGAVIEKMGKRKGIMVDMANHENVTRIKFEVPTRGILGYRNEFVIDTKGEGIFSSRFLEFRPHVGEIDHREVGSMVSMENGKALGYSLFNLQSRGELYIEPNTQVYAGMVIGNVSKGNDMSVNPIKGKKLTNVRASGSDDAINLTPHQEMTIEKGLEIMSHDEYLEVTPQSVRLRKKELK